MGGSSEECDVSKATGNAVAIACQILGYEVIELVFNNNFKKILPILKNADVVFNALHGGSGENGEMQSWMDDNQILYTGSGTDASKICMDKSLSKTMARDLGLLTADWQLIDDPKKEVLIFLPFVVKPNNQGSTVGLSIVFSEKDIKPAIEKAFMHGETVIIEQYIKGRELTVTILGEKAFPIVEIQPNHKLYDYECKYTPGMSKYICPADLNINLAYNIKRDTEKIFKELGCKVYGRADFILSRDSKYYFLEMNTLPGLTKTSLVPKSTETDGLPFEELVKKIIDLSF